MRPCALLAALAVALTACGEPASEVGRNERGQTPFSAPEVGRKKRGLTPFFEDVTAQAGIEFVHDAGRSPARWLPETMGAGVAVLDADGDGRPDLFFVGGGPVPPDGEPLAAAGRNRLYRNLGGWRFEDVTAGAGVAGAGGPVVGMGAASGDVDADGDADLLVTGYGATQLFLNDGGGRFTDATARSGVADPAWTTGASFFDFDEDGRLDLFLQRYVRWSIALHRPCSRRGVEVYCTPDALEPMPSRLLRGRGDGTFEDVSATSGVGGHPGKGLGVVTGDFDGDGDPDVYCANDTHRNLLFVNEGGGRFDEQGLVSGAAYGADGREEAGMGTDAADVDGDGDSLPELLVTNFENEPTDVYRNEGGMSFTEVSALSGVAAPSLPLLGFGIRAADFDLDGLVDLAVANGHVYDNAPSVAPSSRHAQPGQLLRGLPGGRFEDATAARGGDLARPVVGRALATADLDDDGDLDVILTTNGGPPVLLRNSGPGEAAWIGVRCVGTRRDATALGARVSVTAGGRTQVQEVRSGASYLAQSDLRLVFGLGAADRVESVVVRWPGGARQEIRDVPARGHVTVTEGQDGWRRSP